MDDHFNDLELLDNVCEKYFHISSKIARRKAALGALPIPAFRLAGTRKGPFYVQKSAIDKYVADKIAKAQTLNHQMRMAGAV